MKDSVNVWAPATIANLSVGFDALGCALEAPGEVMVLRRTEQKGEVRITRIEGAKLDFNASNNVAGVAAQSLLHALGNPCGLELEIHKQILPGSGIGSSAASAAAAVVGVNELLEAGLRPDELIAYALDGEALASGARHADNVAPAIMGGIVLCTPHGAPQHIPIPPDWHLVVLHPQVEIKTADARAVLPERVTFQDAIRQSSTFASFVAACFAQDGVRAALNLEDFLVEPHRRALIPYFDNVRARSFECGSRAVGISGSGPSTFHIAMNPTDAQSISDGLSELLNGFGLEHRVYLTKISARGAHVLP